MTPIAAFTHELGRLFIKHKQREADKVFTETPRSFLVHQADGHVFKVEVHHLRSPIMTEDERQRAQQVPTQDRLGRFNGSVDLAEALVSDHSGLE